MPAAVSDRPPRNGPIRRYFIPLNALSSGFAESEFSSSAALGALAACAGCAAWAGFTAFDCRSGFVCALAPLAESNNMIVKMKHTTDEGLRKVLRPIETVSGRIRQIELW